MKAYISTLIFTISTASLLAACGSGGSSFTPPAVVEPPPPAPTVAVSAPAAAIVGVAFDVEWTSTDATSCTSDFTTSTATSDSVSVTEDAEGAKTYSVTCTGYDGTSVSDVATVNVNGGTTEGLWQGTTDNGRDVSGVVTKEGDYWLVYSQSGGEGSPVGFYAGNAVSTPSSPTGGAFSSPDLRQVAFDSGTVSVGEIASAAYTVKTSLAGSFAAVGGGASAHDITGSFGVTATVFGSPLTIPMTVTAGDYNSLSGTGGWSMSADLSGLGMGILTFDQTFTIDAATGLGVLNPATNCVGNSIACGGIGPEFYGPLNAGGAIVAGAQNWVVTTPNFGSPTFAPILTEVQTGLPSITAHTFNLGTYNPVYEAAPAVASVAGSYNVGWTGIDAAINNAVVLTVGQDGSISGSDAASGCTYTGGPGALAVHATGGNVYNVTITFSGSTCVYSAQSLSGVAIYVATDHKLTLTALNSARDKGFMVIATKQ